MPCSDILKSIREFDSYDFSDLNDIMSYEFTRCTEFTKIVMTALIEFIPFDFTKIYATS